MSTLLLALFGQTGGFLRSTTQSIILPLAKSGAMLNSQDCGLVLLAFYAAAIDSADFI